MRTRAILARRLARRAAGGVLCCALGLAAMPALGSSFLDDLERGRAAVRDAGVSRLEGTAARAGAVDALVERDDQGSAAFQLGAQLAGLTLDLAPGRSATRDRAVVERQVRAVLAAQAATGIGNRALCLLADLPDPRAIEKLMRVVVAGWSCSTGSEHAH